MNIDMGSARARWGLGAAALLGLTATGLFVGPALAGNAANWPAAKSEHWGVIDRNTIGSPVAELRDGPYSPLSNGQISAPPFGKGSLGIEVANFGSGTASAEKVAYGNEVDFLGNPVSGLTQVGFQVFQTGENTTTNGPATNMPNITIEINPHVAGKTYTSMVWDPPASPVVDQWSPYLDATNSGVWYFSGSTGTATSCGISNSCTLAQAQAALVAHNDGTGAATILTVAIAKGRDYAWQGAVDGLRINDKVYDFETDGVHAH